MSHLSSHSHTLGVPLVLLALLAGGFSQAAQPPTGPADEPQGYRATAPIMMSGDEGAQRLNLPLAALQAARRPDGADIRVINALGQAVPQAWLPAPETTEQRGVSLPLFSWPRGSHMGTTEPTVRVRIDDRGAIVDVRPLHEKAGSAEPMQWLLDTHALRDLTRNDVVTALRLQWRGASGDFVAALSLQSSDNLMNWTTLAQGVLLQAAASAGSSVPTLNQNLLELPPDGTAFNRSRYWRLSVDRELQLSAVQALVRSTATRVREAVGSWTFQALPTSGQTGVHAWKVDLGGPLLLRSIGLQLPRDNTLISAHIYCRADSSETWRWVAAVRAYRLKRAGQDLQSAPVVVDTVARECRLVLDPDSAEMDLPSVPAQITWQVPSVLFVAQGPAPFWVAVGAPAGTPPPPQTDWRALLPDDGRSAVDAQLEHVPVAELGTLRLHPEVTPGWRDQLLHPDPARQRRWLLWSVLGASVLLLGYLAKQLLGETKHNPPAP